MKLLERDSPLRELAALFGAVPTDGGRIVLVCGEAGIGKTSLVDHFANAHRGRARILWGACDALFTPRPLGPLFDIADQLPDDRRARLFADSSRSGLFAAALSELSQALTILVLEDLHWADEATLDLVKYLGRRVQRTRALILATYRDDEMGPRHPLRTVLGDLSSAAAMHRLALAPLSLEAVRVLVGEKDVDPAALHLRTNGNPFFVTEVLASGANGVPVTTRDAVLTRVARLSPLAQSIAALAALMPGGADVGLIEAILHCSPAALDECVERGGLHTVANGLAFRHELARQAVEDSLPVGRLRDLHARILAALESAEAGADTLTRLVHHAVRAGDQVAVLRYAPPAARHASAVGAHREAATLYEAALASGPQLPTPERADLLEGLSFEYYLIDHIEEALLACTGVIQIWQTLGERERAGDSLRWLSRLQWAAGRRAEAEVRADEAIATLEALPPGKALAMAYSNKSQLHMLAWDDAAAIDWGQRALDLAERVDALEIQVHALTNVGSATLLADFEAGVGMLERALLLARANSLHDHASRCYANLSTACVQLYRYAPARRWFEEGLAYTTALDLDFYSVYLLGFQARLCFEMGHWAEAEAHAVEALRLSTRPQTITPLPALIALGHLKVRQGDPGAVALLDQARAAALPTGELQRIGPLAAARAEAAWQRGDLVAVEAEARVGYALALACNNPWDLGQMGYWLWRAGAKDLPVARMARPYALMIAGDWRSAAADWADVGRPYEQAEALAAGDDAAQRAALRRFESLGAWPAAERVRSALATRGVRATSGHSLPARRPDDLTDREREVLRAMAAGLSNPEIAERLVISTGTVKAHSANIYGKLGVNSRVQALIRARELGLIETTQHK